MSIGVEYLIDFPVKRFCSLYNTDTPYNDFVYLLNQPIRGMNPEKSKNKIPIGTMGFLRYLSTVTYSIGYVFELAKAYTSVYPTHILIGSIPSEVEQVGDITTHYGDNHITILHNKRFSSFLILPAYNSDIPQPIIVSS